MECQDHRTPTDAEAFAFAHLAELASLLHANGARDMALLLDGIGDLHNLALRRAAKGGGSALLAPSDAVTDYVIGQVGDLARLMEAHGLGDAALLLRLPAKLKVAADRRREVGTTSADIYVLPPARPAARMRLDGETSARKAG